MQSYRPDMWILAGIVFLTVLGNVYIVSGVQQNELKTRRGTANNASLDGVDGEAAASSHHDAVEDASGERHGGGLCCGRHQKFLAIGFGVSGEVVQIDAGHCRKSCKLPHLDTTVLMDSSGSTSVADAQVAALQACPAHHSCSPVKSRLQRVSTLHGVQEVEVVAECGCRDRPSRCTRLSHELLVNPGTPHETSIDVGSCGGHCGSGTGCRALRNQTMSVAGPNGDQCHSVIAECGCMASCYRASYKESVYDYSEGEHNSTLPVIKEIDVGKCVGSCSGEATRKCVFRDRVNPNLCLAGLYSGRRSECAAAQFAVNRYMTKEKEPREIISITDCRCA